MASAPLVSIVIPCYNPGRMLEPCLASCFSQTHPSVEIILVDNNSTDGSLERARGMGRGQAHELRLASCPTQGQNFARNHGLTEARGRYIQWLDADDELSADKIACQIAALENHAEADIAYGDWEWRFLAEGASGAAFAFPARQYDDFLLCLLANHWSPPHAYLLRREAAERLRALGLWRPETRVGADREYFTLAALIGCGFVYAEGGSARYNAWSGGQITKSHSDAARAAACAAIFARLREQADKEPPSRFTPEHRRLLEQSWALHRAAARPPGAGRRGLGRLDSLALAVASQIPHPKVLEEHAALAALGLWLGIVGKCAAAGKGRLEALRRLRQVLGMSEAIAPEDERDAARLPLRPLPYIAPILMKERLVIRRALDRLVERGLLVPAGP